MNNPVSTSNELVKENYYIVLKKKYFNYNSDIFVVSICQKHGNIPLLSRPSGGG